MIYDLTLRIFDVLVTGDLSLSYQQNLIARRIAIVS